MKIKLVLAGLIIMQSAFADQAQMNATLVQAIAELQHIKPLIAEAEAEKPAGSLVQFESFIGPDGKLHNGIKEDVDAITDGLLQIVNQTPVDPKHYAPIAGDYVGGN